MFNFYVACSDLQNWIVVRMEAIINHTAQRHKRALSISSCEVSYAMFQAFFSAIIASR